MQAGRHPHHKRRGPCTVEKDLPWIRSLGDPRLRKFSSHFPFETITLSAIITPASIFTALNKSTQTKYEGVSDISGEKGGEKTLTVLFIRCEDFSREICLKFGLPGTAEWLNQNTCSESFHKKKTHSLCSSVSFEFQGMTASDTLYSCP